MLSISSYVMDMEYVYIDPDTLKVSMVVLPVVREGRKIDVFLKEMFMGIRYDQTEDCSYVASLLNLLGGAGTFSIHTFKEEINRLKKENNSKPQPQGQILDSQLCMQAFEKPPQPYRHIPQSYQQNVQQNTPAGRNGGGLSEEDRKLIVRDLKREKNLDILFSEEEEVKKEKKGFFFMKDKSEKEKKPEKEKKEDKKKEKKSLWGKLTGKKRSSEEDSPTESPLGRIDIPGMEAAIPFQNVEINKRRVDMQDFGETVFLDGDDDEETYIIGAKQNTVQPEFILYRHGTGESYRISEEVTRIGRSTSIAEICITGNRGIGRVHALLYLRNGEVFIEDNNSKNHTYVDGVKLEPGQSPVKLVHGSKIRLGDEELEFAVQ